ncbi:MAG: hypothetical protein COB24_03540 [Hyphomicrobiales bacterium]|nr:MAG: hypothetical protein COB24_03540 [Hyphomicrobiales bacterium]
MSERIEQEEIINASAADIYAALTQADIFREMTGPPAEISADEGGEFSLFGGFITGRNIELVSGVRLVQAWRSKSWDEGVYSVVLFTFEEADGKTLVKLVHTGFPVDQKPHLEEGWHKNYWSNLSQKFG